MALLTHFFLLHKTRACHEPLIWTSSQKEEILESPSKKYFNLNSFSPNRFWYFSTISWLREENLGLLRKKFFFSKWGFNLGPCTSEEALSMLSCIPSPNKNLQVIL